MAVPARVLVVGLVGALVVGLLGLVALGLDSAGHRHPDHTDRPVQAIVGRVVAPSRALQIPLVVAGAHLSTSTPEVLFVGASYTAGLGATPATDGYAFATARDLGWRAEVDGVPGTGYLNPGRSGAETFAARIAKIAPPIAPDVVVLQSGRNDLGYPLASLRAAELSTIKLVQTRWPSAHLVVLGAIPAHVPVSSELQAVESTLKATATTAGAPFIDPIGQDWITTANQRSAAGPVPQHPGDVGYAYLATRLSDDLRTLLPSDTQG
jgi:lysophospholipase L1-like esterase